MLKRCFDIVFSALALFLLTPVFIILAILIRIRLGKPVLFKQVRPGIQGKPFMLYKFRSMTEACGPNGELLPDSQRLTAFGQKLRNSSLDELPSLLNVLRGEMSFVGPRPLLMEYLPRYTPEQARRHEVPPGITGWAQVNGRNVISWEEKFRLDVWYIDNQSFWLDFRILLLTIKNVLIRKGVTAEGHATMPVFRGDAVNNNVLILAAGRRVELLESFKASLKKYFPGGKVYATDLNPALSAACQIADGYFQSPPVSDDSYIHFLLELCREQRIGMLIPTIDTELILLAENKERFKAEGIDVVISEKPLVEICRDKRKTNELFSGLDIESPAIYEKGEINFPCFVKPFDGSCSKGAYKLLSKESLTPEIINDNKNLFMELVPGNYIEYTIDAYFDINGELRCLVPRERVEVRAGEISKGITRKNAIYAFLNERLKNLQGARGCLTVQVFYEPGTGSVKGLEINPRFGGGYPLAEAAGANYSEWLIREYFLGDEIPYWAGWEQNLTMLRYDTKVLVHEKNDA